MNVLQLPALNNLHRVNRDILPTNGYVLCHLDNLHAIRVENPSENDVLSVEPVTRNCSEEKLAAVGSRARVRHGKQPAGFVRETKVLVIKLMTEN